MGFARYPVSMLGLSTLLLFGLALLIALLAAMLAREMRRPPRHTAGYAVAHGLACDPGERGIDFDQWQLDRPDGAILPVWEAWSSQRSPTGQSTSQAQLAGSRLTAVFVHGWGHSRIDALARIEPLVSLCQRLVFYDLRGHGDSQHCLSRLGHDEDQDLLALLERLGEGRFVLVGHSMGAVIAIAAAAGAAVRHQAIASRIAGVIAYGPYCEFHQSLQGRLRIAGYPRRPITDLALLIHKARGLSPLSLREQDAADLPCPLLVIHGREDCVSPLAHSKRIVAAARDAVLHEIPGGGHLDGHLIDPIEHERIVRDFIKRLTPPASESALAMRADSGAPVPGL